LIFSLNHIAKGDITILEGSALISAMANMAIHKEKTELEERIALLEKKSQVLKQGWPGVNGWLAASSRCLI
jgi:hypothetical protein